jgi:hypothetical protein
MNRFIALRLGLVGIIIGYSISIYVPLSFAQTSTSSRPNTSPSASPRSQFVVPQEAPPAGIDLTVSPTFLNLVTDPGKPVASQIQIKNNNNFTEYLEISISKFNAAEGGARPLISEMQPEDEYAKWVSFEDQQFKVDSNETKTIKFTIAPSEDASLGYYYAFVINRIQQQQSEGNQAVVAGAPAILTLLDVRSPNATREVQLVDFKTDKFFYEYPPINFQVKLKNSGNIHLAPVGDIFIGRDQNLNIATLRANEGRANILPQTEREYNVTWNDGLITTEAKTANGETNYSTRVDFDQPISKFRIGKYTAHLVMVYDNGQRDIPLEASVTFWVIPWKIIGGILILLAAPIVIFIFINRMRRRRVRG